MYDVLIIGAGIIGSSIARNLSRYQLNVVVLEKENDVGNVTTSANSAIVHSGYDPVPGTLKAKFNVLGNQMFDQIAEELDVSFKRISSLTVATHENQIPILEDLKERAKLNGVPVKLLTRNEVLKIEPNLNDKVIAALQAPTAGIIDPFNLCVHTMENAIDNGVKLFLNEYVTKIENLGNHFKVHTKNHVYETKMVINAAGLGSTKIANMIEKVDWEMTPRKGEYYVLDHEVKNFVNTTIFPLPSAKGKGILVSPTYSGDYLVGPSSELTASEEETTTDGETLARIRQEAEIMVKNIPFKTTIRQFAGVRATCSRHDFIIEYSKSSKYFINVSGIESPGLASSPAIGKYVVEELVKPVLKPKENPKFNPYIKKYKTKDNITNEDIKANPKYGKMICSCESVSLGEMEDALARSCPPHSVKGMKKRTRAGFGLCQGGFCQSRVVFLMAKHYGVSPLDIPLNNEDSKILLEKVKQSK